MKKILAIIGSVVVAAALAATPIIDYIKFDQGCAGYLKQAADANSIELCKASLDKAIAYADAHGLTEGYTSVLYRTEDENIGFWYSNLKACQSELESISADATILEKSNLLMKVRESLLDDEGEKGTVVTCPDGIQYYPHNVGSGALRISAAVVLVLGFFLPVILL